VAVGGNRIRRHATLPLSRHRERGNSLATRARELGIGQAGCPLSPSPAVPQCEKMKTKPTAIRRNTITPMITGMGLGRLEGTLGGICFTGWDPPSKGGSSRSATVRLRLLGACVLGCGWTRRGRNPHARFPARRRACTFVRRGATHAVPPIPVPPASGEPRVPRPPIIESERVILRMAELEDAPEIVRYFQENREHLADSRPTMSEEFFTEEFWRGQVYAAQSEFRADRSLRLFTFEKSDPRRPIANVNFVQFNRGAAQYCVLGYGIARDREGQGLMREGLEAAIGYVFGTLNMHRIMANYVPWNQRSGGLLRRLGFVVEGYARDYLFLDGQWQDHVLTSLTNPHWRPEE